MAANFLSRISTGTGPDAFFYIGKHGTSVTSANSIGIKIPYPKSSGNALGKFTGSTLILELPENTVTDEIGWFSVWCKQYSVDFGHIVFNQNSQSEESEVEGNGTRANIPAAFQLAFWPLILSIFTHTWLM